VKSVPKKKAELDACDRRSVQSKRYAPLSSEAKCAVGARPSKCIIIIHGGSASAVQENWAYDLADDIMPEWVKQPDHRPRPAVGSPDKQVLIGIHLEDGPRLERYVRQDTSEHGLRIFMWKELGRPQKRHYLYMRDGCTPRSSEEQWGRKECGCKACGLRGYPTDENSFCEQSWKLATGCGRLRAKGYACDQ
jgi:hypothetical protein